MSRAVSKRSRPFSRAGGHVAVLALDNRARRTYSELLRRTLQEIRLFGGCEVQIRNPRIPNPENHFLLSKLGMPWGSPSLQDLSPSDSDLDGMQITLARKFVPLFLIDGNHKADPLCWEKVEQCALACEGKPPTLLMPDTIASFGRTRQAQSQLNGCRACGCALRNKSSILPDETRVRESKSSIKRDVKKKVLPRPEAERICLEIQPTSL